MAGVLMVAAFAGVIVAQDKALKELEGTYKVITLEKGGKTADKSVVEAVQIGIKGDELVIIITKDNNKKEEKKAKIKVDSSSSPHTIDITPSDGPEKGKTFPGIFKVEKGEVVLAFTEKGDRPKEFKSEGEVLLVKMKKDEKK
jgi:uncharacterized protein (TIGR03067 family)